MIKKVLRHFVFIFILFFSVLSSAKQKVLVVGVTAQYPPFVFIEERRITGFDVDLVTAIADDLGYDLEFKDMEFKELFSALKDEEIDIAVSGISATQERKKFIDFSHSYYFPKLAILTMKKESIDSLKLLKGKTVAAVTGTTVEKFLVRTLSVGRQIKVMSFVSMDFMLKALEVGQIDAILTEDVIARNEQDINNDLSYFIIEHPKYSISNSYAIAFQKNSGLRSEFNNGLLQLKMSEQFSTIQKKWGIK